MALRDVLRYLVTLQLSGRSNAVRAIYDYFVRGNANGSVAELAERYGLEKKQLKNYVLHVLKWSGSINRVQHAKLFVKALAPLVLQTVEPIIGIHDDTARCRVCGTTFPSHPWMLYHHVSTKHRDLVEQHVDTIISILRECCRKGAASAR